MSMMIDNPSIQDVEASFQNLLKKIERNTNMNKRTFVKIFFAGHAAIINNQFAVLVNEDQQPSGKLFAFPIEQWLYNNLVEFRDSISLLCVYTTGATLQLQHQKP